MSGTVIRVIEDTHYEFSGLASSNQQGILIAQRVDVSQFRTASLLVRVIKLNIGTSGDAIKVEALIDPWDPFQGTTVFQPPGGTTGEASVPLPQSTLNPSGDGSAPPTDPYAMYFPLNTPFGGLIQLGLFGVRGGGSAGDALDIQLNADLILKD
jgi:hypothetical protein